MFNTINYYLHSAWFLDGKTSMLVLNEIDLYFLKLLFLLLNTMIRVHSMIQALIKGDGVGWLVASHNEVYSFIIFSQNYLQI